MSVSVERNARKYLNVQNGVALNCDFPCFDAAHVVVRYGRAGTLALADVDYTVALDEPNAFATFTVTPTVSLVTKINNAIVADPDEVNQVVVRRVLPHTTDITPETASFRRKISEQFDRLVMMFQQLAEFDKRTIRVAQADVDADVAALELPDKAERGNAGAGSCLEFDDNGNVVLGPRTSTVLAQTETARDAALAAQAAAETAETNAETAETNAETAQAASEAARDTAQLWAVKTTGAVSGGEFSAKAHASSTDADEPASGSAKSWAQRVGAAVVAGAYSAKEWAVGTFTRGAAGGGSAKDWATYTGGTVDGADYSAKRYASIAAGALPWVNVKSYPYGAVGDGVTDDAPAIQAALTALKNAGGGTLYFPRGTYRLGSQQKGLVHAGWYAYLSWEGVNAPLHIVGEGVGASKISGLHAYSHIYLWAGDSAGGELHVTDIEFVSDARGVPNTYQGPMALSIGENDPANCASFTAFSARRVYFNGQCFGIHGRGASHWLVEDCVFRTVGSGTYPAYFAEAINGFGDGGDTAKFRSATIRRCRFVSDALYGDHSVYVFFCAESSAYGDLIIEDNEWEGDAPTNSPIKINGGSGAVYLRLLRVSGNRIVTAAGASEYGVVVVRPYTVVKGEFNRNTVNGSATLAAHLYLEGEYDVLETSGNRFSACQQSSIYVSSGPVKLHVCDDNHIVGYNASGAGSFPGVWPRKVTTFKACGNTVSKGHAAAGRAFGHQDATAVYASGNWTDAAPPEWCPNAGSAELADVMFDGGNSWNDPAAAAFPAGHNVVRGSSVPCGLSAQTVTAGATVVLKGGTVQVASSSAVTLSTTAAFDGSFSLVGTEYKIVNVGAYAITFPHGGAGNFVSKTGADLVVPPSASFSVVRTYAGSTVIRQSSDMV